MATVKKVSRAKVEFENELNSTKPLSGAKVKRNTFTNDKNELDAQLALVQNATDTVWVHNVSGAEFHVPPVSFKTEDSDTAIVFEVDQVVAFDRSELENKRFKKCLMDKKLRIVSEEQVAEIEKAREKSSKRTGKKTGGLAESGLPRNTKAALDYIFNCTDIDELESYAELEERTLIEEAIDERIDELEGEDLG